MASHPREVDKALIIPPDAVTAALEQYRPDLGNWPQSWRIEDQNVPIGERIVESLKPFLINLLMQGLADKTLARHRDHMWLLGGEIIRRRHDDPDRAKMPVEDLLFDLLEDEGGPLIWPRITASEQNAFDATCRKLYRFRNQAKPRS